MLLAVSLPFSLAQTGTVSSGTVKANGQAIPGATVRATQGERSLVTLSDENGAFRFDGLTPGAWVVEADMFGFEHLRRDVQVGATPSSLELNLQLATRASISTPAVRSTSPNTPAPESEPAPTAVAEFAPQVSADSSNESFVVNGSVSEAVRTNQQDFAGFGPGGFGPGGFPGGEGGQFGGPGGPGGGDNPALGDVGPGGRGGPGV